MFTCHYTCSVTEMNSHTTLWILGDMIKPTTFTNGKSSRDRFTRRAGPGITIVDVVEKSNCDEKDGQLKYELRVNVTDAKRWNRTPVQCVAQASTLGQKNFFSTYSVLLVEPLHSKMKSFVQQLTGHVFGG